MAYLRGPITRAKLRELNALVGVEGVEAIPEIAVQRPVEVEGAVDAPSVALAEDTSMTRPTVPARVEEYFLPNNLTVAEALKREGEAIPEAKVIGLVYRPALLAQAVTRYLDRKIDLDHEERSTAMALELSRRGAIRWEDMLTSSVAVSALDRAPAPESQFAALEAPLNEPKTLKDFERDFLDYLYHKGGVHLLHNPELEIIAQPGMTKAEFHQLCSEAARDAQDADKEKLKESYEKKIKRIEDRLVREERELAEDQAELSGRKMEEMATHAENVLGLFTGSRSRRRVSSSLTKRRMTEKAKADVEESLEMIEEFKQELAELENELVDELEEIEERWAEAASNIEETVIRPFKKNIQLELFGIAWFPHWRLEDGGRIIEVEGFNSS
jgi:hypothetical protein